MTCKCNVSQKVLGDGCRYCQPQTYIDYLESAIADYRETDEKPCLSIDRLRADNEALRAKLAEPRPVPLAVKRTGMRISAEGVLGRIRDGRYFDGLRFGCGEMLRHLEQMASRFYAGDIAAVDEFLQLYCLDHKRPEQEPAP